MIKFDPLLCEHRFDIIYRRKHRFLNDKISRVMENEKITYLIKSSTPVILSLLLIDSVPIMIISFDFLRYHSILFDRQNFSPLWSSIIIIYHRQWFYSISIDFIQHLPWTSLWVMNIDYHHLSAAMILFDFHRFYSIVNILVRCEHRLSWFIIGNDFSRFPSILFNTCHEHLYESWTSIIINYHHLSAAMILLWYNVSVTLSTG